MSVMKSVVMILMAVVGLFVPMLEAASPEGVNLARMEGWDIVISKDAIPSDKYAINEL